MLTSPFHFHGPLEPAQVTGRDQVVADLVERVTARRPTVLVAPRRFGKTSVLGRVASELRASTAVIRVDLYELRSWADLAARLDDALAAVVGEPRRTLDRIAAGFELNLGVVKASFVRPDRPDPGATADRLLDVIVAHAERVPTVLMLDEFSSIVRVDGAAGLLRTKLQHHFSAIGLLFAGSEPTTMRMLFSEVDQPFFAQADLVDLPGLDRQLVGDLVDAGFDGTPPAGLAGRIFAFTDGHPQRTMQVADAAWRVWRDGAEGGLVWERALEVLRASSDSGHELRFANFSTAEQAVMRLSASRGVLHGRDAELLELSSSSATNAKRTLVDRGQIAADDRGRVHVIDPLFADWIRRRFPI